MILCRPTTCLLIFLTACAILAQAGSAEPLPVIVHYPMDAGPAAGRLTDAGPLKLHAKLAGGAELVSDADRGTVLHLPGKKDAVARFGNSFINKLGSPITFAAWIKLEELPAKDKLATIISKRPTWWMGKPFSLHVTHDGRLRAEMSNGKDWLNENTKPLLKANAWHHVALTHTADGDAVLYVDGAQALRKKFEGTLAANDQQLVLGFEDTHGGGGVPFHGWMDEVYLLAAPLAAEQIGQLSKNQSLDTRAAKDADLAQAKHYVQLRLARFDMPKAFAKTDDTTRQTARRIDGVDAVDWPTMTLVRPDGAAAETLFEKSPTAGAFFPLLDSPKNMSVYAQPYDQRLLPGDHWFRATSWLWGRRFAYTSQRTARAAEKELEIWTFPIVIQGPGEADIRSVRLDWDGQTYYARTGTWRSLTLLLPASGEKPYSLIVNDRPPVQFHVGLKPIDLANPKDEPLAVSLTLPGDGPAITVANLDHPQTFPHEDDYAKDLQQLEQAKAYASAATARDPNVPGLIAGVDMDSSGKDLKLRDGATLVADDRGSALSLDGKKATAVVADSDALHPLIDNFTIAFRFNPRALPAKPRVQGDNRAMIVSKRPHAGVSTPWSIGINERGQVLFDGNDGSTWLTVHSPEKRIQPNAWHHIAVTYRAGDAVRLYVDGKQVASRSAGKPLAGNREPVVLGFEAGWDGDWGARAHFNGLVDDLRFYDTVLTAEQLAEEREGALKSQPGIAAKWPLPQPFAWERAIDSPADYLGIEVARSPVANYAVSLSHGMSGGFFLKSDHGPSAYNKGIPFNKLADAAGYAKHLAEAGYDLVFEQTAGNFDNPSHALSHEALLAALTEHGVRGGLNYTFLQDSNLPLYAATLPQWRQPRYRDAQLMTQRAKRFDGFVGATMGADNGGYAYFWDWSPPIPEKHWGWAIEALLGSDFSGTVPTAAADPNPRAHEHRARSVAELLAYVDRYDQTFTSSYGYFASALATVDPSLILTTGSFGSSPGVLATGGWKICTVPGEAMFARLPVLQSYDWNETKQTKPVHNIALMDRLRSDYPDKPAWAILDDFDIHQHGPARQREYALALTRGLDAVGSSWLPQPTGDQKRPEVVETQKQINDHVRTLGGVFALTEPAPTIAILYVNEQSLLRTRPDHSKRQQEGKVHTYGHRDAMIAGPHEGKTTEALFLCHAAGYPAKIVTPNELKRGLPPSVKAILLVGLNQVDDSWAWHHGLEPQLKSFVEQGGRVLLDHESVSPVPATKTEMEVFSYLLTHEGHGLEHYGDDVLEVMFLRNEANIARLRSAMKGITVAPARSGEPTVWSIPTTAGQTQYVTVLNYGFEPGKNPWKHVKPQQAKLQWETDRPIYRVRDGRRMNATEAADVDLTSAGFELFALPPAEPSGLEIAVQPHEDGFHRATITASASGLPVRLDVKYGEQVMTVHSATGLTAKLPITARFPGQYTVTATELLTRQSTSATVDVAAQPERSATPGSKLAAFMDRKHKPLFIALTPEQVQDAALQPAIERLQALLRSAGRDAAVRTIAPNDILLSRQPYASAFKFPQWYTADADLVLLGDVTTNLLLLDQARGHLLPAAAMTSQPLAHPFITITHSPFRGECDVLSLLAPGKDLAGTIAALETWMRR
jgi:hypothetical protein